MLESEMNRQVSMAAIGNLSRATGHSCIEDPKHPFRPDRAHLFSIAFRTGPGTTLCPIYSLTCNIILSPGSNRNASYKCQWIIHYGKLIRYISASLFGVREEETANASWINLVLLSFEVLLHVRSLVQDCRALHA